MYIDVSRNSSEALTGSSCIEEQPYLALKSELGIAMNPR